MTMQNPTTGGLNEGKDSLGESSDGQNPTTGGLKDGSDPLGGSNGGQDPTTSESPKG